MSEKKSVMKRVWVPAVCGAVALGCFGVAGVEGGGFGSVGAAGSSAALPAVSASASVGVSAEPVPAVEYESVETSPDGLTLYSLGEGQLPVTYDAGSGNFVSYADIPAHTFTEAESKCELTAQGEVDLSGQATVWSIPSIGASTGYTQTNFQLPATVDSAGRYGTWKSDTAPLFSDSGAGFYAGHVNMADGSRSAWGKLHQIQPCAHKYITDETGAQREYVAVSLTLVTNPSEIESNGEYWRLDGQNAIYDVTCAGKYGVGDDGQSQLGGSLFASFPYRIVVKYLPVV